jgi:CubicO group peptidase (beta-lactamase class C family)
MSQRSLAAMAATMVLQLVLLWSVAAQAETLQAVTHPEELGFDVTRLERMTKAFQGYVDAGQLPGAVVLIARHDQVAYAQAFGYLDREAKAAMTPDSIFRIASMTKPIV